MDYKVEMGRAIRAERARAGLSQAKLAKKVGVVTGTLIHWEAGRREPRYTDLLTLSKQFKRKPVDWVPNLV